MKQRIISAIVGLVVLAIVLTLFDTVVLNIAISVIIAMSVYELLKAVGDIDLPIRVVAILFGATVPFFKTSMISRILPPVCLAFAVLMLIFTLKYHGKISVEKIGFSFFYSMAIAFSITCVIFVRDLYGMAVGFYAAVMALGGAWLNDTGAYFSGMMFGKHKLAPVISPKKTVEGFVGGIIVSLFSQLLLSFIFQKLCAIYGVVAQINYLLVAVVAPFIALAAVLGDLSASVMKRQFKIKDFGNIMPGHGGALDRFDSAFVTIPLVYIILLYLPIIIIK